MNIEFLKFTNGENWVNGIVNDGEFFFEAKLFDGGSIYGINEGRVSKMSITVGGKGRGFADYIVNYDRGWDIEPITPDDTKVYEAVLHFLENAPTTRFD